MIDSSGGSGCGCGFGRGNLPELGGDGHQLESQLVLLVWDGTRAHHFDEILVGSIHVVQDHRSPQFGGDSSGIDGTYCSGGHY